jgi:acyl-CoA synthetase (AMP-forming)/AMP-acid ligase II
MPWNYGDILDAISPVLPPEAPAFIHGSRAISWSETTRRSNNLARALLAKGAQPRDKVAFYMRNRPEYVEMLAAAFKARLTHVNVNYRYLPDEVFYIFDDSDAQTVVYGSEFRDVISQIRTRLTKVKTFIEIADGSPPANFAFSYEALARDGDGAPLGIARSPEDEFFIYTGGTTGMPKGVIWTHNDLRETQLAALRRLGPVPENLEQVVEAIKTAGPGPRLLPACPLMHGTGLLMANAAMLAGGCVITLTAVSLDAHELFENVARHKAASLVIVGDAFAKPMLQVLNEQPGRYDTSSVVNVVSSGVMWSREIKHGLLEHMPQAMLVDSFGSSEAVGFGSSIMTKDGEIQTAKFQIGERCRVFDENDRPVEPGSGIPGIIAQSAPIPIGYYKDPVKTAKTFKVIDGVRYSMPGDWCVVETDGTLTLLGRGSVCINTAGEKVYPEEVEEALKTHPAVDDVLVVGVPDDKWGQAVTAVVRTTMDVRFDEEELRKHVRDRLAGYKTPKRVLSAEIQLRAPNGKADYKAALDFARSALGL